MAGKTLSLRADEAKVERGPTGDNDFTRTNGLGRTGKPRKRSLQPIAQKTDTPSEKFRSNDKDALMNDSSVLDAGIYDDRGNSDSTLQRFSLLSLEERRNAEICSSEDGCPGKTRSNNALHSDSNNKGAPCELPPPYILPFPKRIWIGQPTKPGLHCSGDPFLSNSNKLLTVRTIPPLDKKCRLRRSADPCVDSVLSSISRVNRTTKYGACHRDDHRGHTENYNCDILLNERNGNSRYNCPDSDVSNMQRLPWNSTPDLRS